jgi:hypothetical protein
VVCFAGRRGGGPTVAAGNVNQEFRTVAQVSTDAQEDGNQLEDTGSRTDNPREETGMYTGVRVSVGSGSINRDHGDRLWDSGREQSGLYEHPMVHSVQRLRSSNDERVADMGDPTSSHPDDLDDDAGINVQAGERQGRGEETAAGGRSVEHGGGVYQESHQSLRLKEDVSIILRGNIVDGEHIGDNFDDMQPDDGRAIGVSLLVLYGLEVPTFANALRFLFGYRRLRGPCAWSA